MLNSVRNPAALGAALLIVAAPLTGCASWNNKERGVVIGAGAGAAVGGVVGKATGSTARGAIIGAVLGGTAGAVIGHQMDQQAKELDQNIPGATITRVGEGIVVTFDSGLLYDFDSDQVKPAARDNLRNLANSLGKYPNTIVLLVGHTDNVGSATYNQTLSERRASAASRVLAEYGVGGTRLDVEGRGLSEPIASNDSDSGRAENRRVEVAIYASEAYRQQVLRETGR